MDNADIEALLLSLRLAALTTVLLLILGTPLAWWLAGRRSRVRNLVRALVALPLVLPPTVLGFYFLLMMGPQGPLGRLLGWFGLAPLPFTFSGLVLASLLYSLPFVVQPLYAAFEMIGSSPLEAAATLGAAPLDRFLSVVLPMSRSGYLSALVLGFAHTLGEFGVVLMIGGNIPGQTRLVSVQIFDHVEALEYGHAHKLALCMVGFSLLALYALYYLATPVQHSGARDD